MATLDSRRIGPFLLAFEADGDDPGTGIVTLKTDDGYYAETDDGVERDLWNAFCAEVDK